MTKKLCSVGNCKNSTLAKGLCAKHYQRKRRRGTTELLPRIKTKEGLRQRNNRAAAIYKKQRARQQELRKKLQKESYVYIIAESGGDQNVKIGLAADPLGRLKCLQSGNSSPLTVAGLYGPMCRTEAQAYERGLQKRFREYHVHGEWYTNDILELTRED